MEMKHFIKSGLSMIAAGLVWLGTLQAQNEQIVTLQPGPEGKDTYICDCLPTVNNPNGPITVLYQGQYGVCFDRALLRWDLSSLPKNITVTNATMELRCTGVYGAISGRMVYYRLTANWGETQVTTATLPAYTNEDSVVTAWPAAGKWHAVDITKFVQKWIQDSASNFGVYAHCAGTTSQCDAEFYSSDASTGNVRPKLTITYTTATDDVERLKSSQPLNFRLDQNFPNPFNPTTKIQYAIPRSENVSLKVFDLAGNDVVTLVAKMQNAGTYETSLDASRLASGVYIYELRAGNFHDAKKLIVLK